MSEFISSQALEDGSSPCASPDGETAPSWTGSCPCQPLSGAGQRKGHVDERHIWPAFHRLIAECWPPVVFGEQVASKDGRDWFAAVRADLERLGYACGGADLSAAGVSAPHIRQRLWWVGYAPCRGKPEEPRFSERSRAKPGERLASPGGRLRTRWITYPQAIWRNGRRWAAARTLKGRGAPGRVADANGRDAGAEGLQRGGEHGQRAEDDRASGRLGDAKSQRPERESEQGNGRQGETGGPRAGWSGGVGAAASAGCKAQYSERGKQTGTGAADAIGPRSWLDAELIGCADGKARPVEPGLFPLAHGLPGRMGQLRASGNAIVPQVAAEFIAAAMECYP